MALAAVFALAGPRIIDLMATDPGVRETARAFLPWVVAAPLVGVASWMFDGIFIGATMTRAMLKAMAISVACYVLALTALIPLWQNAGLWASLMVLNAMRGVTMAAFYPGVERRAA